MLTVNTSISSLNAQRKLNNSGKSLAVSVERLSSGLRINSARDDAAGLAISNQMTAQTKGIQKSIQNSTDWVSLLQTADGALNEMSTILQRVRELAVQAVNDTNNDSDRSSLNQEVEELVSELDRIAKTTEFNGINLLDGGVTQDPSPPSPMLCSIHLSAVIGVNPGEIDLVWNSPYSVSGFAETFDVETG